MSCEQIVGLMPALAERLLESKELAAVQGHLRTCKACASAWKRHQAIDRHVKTVDVSNRPDSFWSYQRKAILDQVTIGTAKVEVKSPFNYVRAGIATAAAAALLFGLVGLMKPPAAPVVDNGTAKKDTVKTPAPGKDAGPNESDPKALPTSDPEIPTLPEVPEPAEPDMAEKPPDVKPEPPVEGPKDPIVKKPDVPAPGPDVIPPGPEKKEPDIVIKPEPKPEPAKPVEPPVITDEIVATALPGDALYGLKLATEQMGVILPRDEKKDLVLNRDSIELVMSILSSARTRLSEIKPLLDAKKTDAAIEVVDAYAMLVGECAAPIMMRLAKDNKSIHLATGELRDHVLKLMPELIGLNKKLMEPAERAANEARSTRASRQAIRSKVKLGSLAASRETLFVLLQKEIDDRTKAALTVSNRYQDLLIAEAKADKRYTCEAALMGYMRYTEAIVTLLERSGFQVKNFPKAVWNARAEVQRQIAEFSTFPKNSPLRALVEQSLTFATQMKDRLARIELGGSDPGPKTPPPPGVPPPPPPPPPPPEPTPTPDPGFDPK